MKKLSEKEISALLDSESVSPANIELIQNCETEDELVAVLEKLGAFGSAPPAPDFADRERNPEKYKRETENYIAFIGELPNRLNRVLERIGGK